MTLRMPPWEAERVANVLEYARMLTATEPKMKPWMKACAARIKAAVKAEKDRKSSNRRIVEFEGDEMSDNIIVIAATVVSCAFAAVLMWLANRG